MFEIVVVVPEGALGVVWWVDEDALHAPTVKRQQGFQRIKVVTLDQQVRGIAVSVLGDRFQYAVRHPSNQDL